MSQDRGPRCPDPSSAKSRLSHCFSATVRDIPNFRPPNPEWASAISRPGEAPPRIKSRTNGETPRDIADIGQKKSREIADVEPAKAREITDAANRLGISRTKRKARDIADANPKNVTAPVRHSSTADCGRVGRQPHEWCGRPVSPSWEKAWLPLTDPGDHGDAAPRLSRL